MSLIADDYPDLYFEWTLLPPRAGHNLGDVGLAHVKKGT